MNDNQVAMLVAVAAGHLVPTHRADAHVLIREGFAYDDGDGSLMVTPKGLERAFEADPTLRDDI